MHSEGTLVVAAARVIIVRLPPEPTLAAGAARVVVRVPTERDACGMRVASGKKENNFFGISHGL